jgi:hypothetical protein
VWYPLTGPLPAGDYRIAVNGVQINKDGQLHADLLYRPPSGGDQVLASADSGLLGNIDAVVAAPAVSASSGDLLVLRVHMVMGTSPYIELGTSLTIP